MPTTNEPATSPAASSQPPEATRRALDRSLTAGLAWTGLAKWTAQLLSWISTVIVARLLTPGDYGILGMATVYLGLIQLVSEFGLGAALIQRRDLDSSQIARLGGLAVLIGAVLFTLSAAVAPLIAGFFGEPRVRLVVTVLAGMFVVTALQVVPNSLLARDLAFRRLAFIEATEALTQTLVTLALAIAGARYWALVVGGVVAKTLSTALLLWSRPHRLAWPRDLAALRGAVTFGWRVVLSRLAWYTYSNADFVVIGRVLGTQPLGAYTFGWNLASIPVDKITAVLGRVTMPVLSAVQRDRASVARYLLLLSEGIVLVVLPVALGLTLVARDFVTVILGPRWDAAIVPLQALSAHVTFRCLLSPYAQALLALDETRQSVRVGLIQLLIMPAAFFVAAREWGINGVAIAWLVVHPLITIPPLLGYTLRRVDLRAAALFRALWPALSSTGAMVVGVLASHVALAQAPAPVRLAGAISAGVLTYAAVLRLFHWARLRHLIGAARSLASTPAPGA